jgi:hypothetical protein
VPLALTQPFGLGGGIQFPFTPDSPAAGAGFVFGADGRGARRLLSLVFTLTTDANAANRLVTVEYVGRNNLTYAVAEVTATQAASLTNRYVFAIGYGTDSFAAGTDGLAPLPSLFLMPGDQLKIIVANIQVGDQLSAIAGAIERFPLDGEGLPSNPAHGG